MSSDIEVPPHEASLHIVRPSVHTPVALFDASHGQAHWAQTGFTSREMHTNFVGVMETLCRLGCQCMPTGQQPLSKFLKRARLLVIPPPTGNYNPHKECWMPQPGSLFTPEEIANIHAFLRDGGRLFLCAYRFGDSFTNTNLRELISPLGCLLNDDVVIDLHTLRGFHPLHAHFDTPRSCLPLAWSLDGVATVRWRVMATFTILPGTTAGPLALSPGGSCITFNRAHRQIRFVSLPIAVAGWHGKGRFVLIGGPHAFETGTFGLLTAGDNTRFLHNLLRWLLEDTSPTQEMNSLAQFVAVPPQLWPTEGFCPVGHEGPGRSTVTYVEGQLRRNGILKALSRPKWIP